MTASRSGTKTGHALLAMAEALGLRTERRDDGEIVIRSGVTEDAPVYYVPPEGCRCGPVAPGSHHDSCPVTVEAMRRMTP